MSQVLAENGPGGGIVSLDPGRDKCGLALVSPSGKSLWHGVVARAETVRRLEELIKEYGPRLLVLGHATASAALRTEIQAALPELDIVEVDETCSTLEARGLYWAAVPPRGWRRLLPLSLQVPPVPVDDYAAIVLARRYLAAARDPAV